ncbi:co-chaperone GroES [Poriferisphaera sp. WC338]|uniref:co-chaperone GroES n=1 Tax=Poriferisphaera sp. WC338 TaxID=3425129 RepID=UPI003D81734F
MAKTKKINVKPLEDRVLLKPTEVATQTASGIFLPESATEKPMTATIVAVGPGKMTDEGKRGELSVKKGDVVLYGKYAGTEVDIDGVEHLIVRESELLGVVEG